MDFPLARTVAQLNKGALVIKTVKNTTAGMQVNAFIFHAFVWLIWPFSASLRLL